MAAVRTFYPPINTETKIIVVILELLKIIIVNMWLSNNNLAKTEFVNFSASSAKTA